MNLKDRVKKDYSLEDYTKGNCVAVPSVINAESIFGRLINKSSIRFRPYSSNFDVYRENLGKPSFKFKGSEYTWNIWPIKLSESETFLILSAKGAGTTFEFDFGCDVGYEHNLSKEGLSTLHTVMSEIEALIENKYKDEPRP